jgi:hypothetical protein
MSGHGEGEFKYRPFLSYRAADGRQAEWLHRKLEEYVVPRLLVGTPGPLGIVLRRLGRIFRDRDEARSAEHIESAIAEELSQSQQLIVLCRGSGRFKVADAQLLGTLSHQRQRPRTTMSGIGRSRTKLELATADRDWAAARQHLTDLLGINVAGWLRETTVANLDRQKHSSRDDAGAVAEIGRILEALIARTQCSTSLGLFSPGTVGPTCTRRDLPLLKSVSFLKNGFALVAGRS